MLFKKRCANALRWTAGRAYQTLVEIAERIDPFDPILFQDTFTSPGVVIDPAKWVTSTMGSPAGLEFFGDRCSCNHTRGDHDGGGCDHVDCGCRHFVSISRPGGGVSHD